MLRLFRSISRGRRKDNANVHHPSSPLIQSPRRPRNRDIHPNDRVGPEYIDDEHEQEHEDGNDFSPFQQAYRQRQGYFDNADPDDEYNEQGDEDEEGAGDEDEEDTPLLPIFSAAHLDSLPLYNITHAIRQLIVQKCETTLSWDQLRSPQISQFLVKPIQGQIRADHFNRATLCALVANCLQFQKEGQLNPANVGVSRTRALISELLAMRLLREFSIRELIDSLSYDFDPLQGMYDQTSGGPTPGNVTPAVNLELQTRRAQGRVARVSTIEIAIRAEAKRFLAHPVVVQHLEAIWAGNIVFHSEADNLHRRHRRSQETARTGRMGYGTNGDHALNATPANLALPNRLRVKAEERLIEQPPARRAVTLYNPRDASLFKLSRLRVPRYRQVFSTLSFATMLALFVAVLADRSLTITPLEVLFWFWSVGYMLDEVVGFTEQGFGLYILSFWNAFDLGILILFVVYYCLRLYGIVLADDSRHKIAGIAYDVLASTAILLFPRLFSVLDHYRYFSQLLIAFRLMSIDLVAVMILIVICCSGFFVALSLSFADTRDASGVAYSLFQILMGFTPAVWDHWDGYNVLGKMIMAAFLTICHFMIVTILITVLTNSFMAIVKNAEEEHQFLFAVNTISMVKSDALFSYVAPSNIVGWLLSPIRFLLPMRTYVRLNRTFIKFSHFPILFAIFGYERMIMARTGFAPAELVERTRVHQKQPVAFGMNKSTEFHAVSHRLREPSVISFNKDRALDEVFRRPFRGDTIRTTTREMEIDQRHSNAVDNWMQLAENEGGASPPIEQPRSVVERLEHRRSRHVRGTPASRLRMLQAPREFSPTTRSAASDPDPLSLVRSRRPYKIVEESEGLHLSTDTLPQDTEADGDDEINDESDDGTPAIGESAISIQARTPGEESEPEFFQTPTGPNSPLVQLSHAARARLANSPELSRGAATPPRVQVPTRRAHARQISNSTVLFAPQANYDSSTSNNVQQVRPLQSKNNSGGAGASTPIPGSILHIPGTRTPGRNPVQPTKSRPIMPPRQKTAPNIMPMVGLNFIDQPRARHRNPSFNARALDLASDLGDNKWGPSGGLDAGGISGMPASFSEQMMRERDVQRRVEDDRRRTEDEEKTMVNRIMLARMHTLEEGFREMLREVKDLSQSANSNSRRESEVDSGGAPMRIKTSRPKIETASSSLGNAGWQTPKTPIGRIGGNEKSKRTSPRKPGRMNSKKGKENERPGSGGGAIRPGSREGELAHQLSREHRPEEQGASPESVRSVVELPRQEAEQAGAGAGEAQAARPSTAIYTQALLNVENSDEDKA